MKRILVLVLLFSLATTLSLSAEAAETAFDNASTIDEIADEYIGKTVPGACVIIAEHGKIVFSKSYGYADIEKKIPIDLESTAFEWGSITKTFVWVSVMQQVEAGHLDLSQDIRSYLPSGFLKNLRFDAPITMLHLMNHTAGFSEHLFDLRYQDGDSEQPLEIILSAHQPQQEFEPGIVSAYSNWGAALAALIVERVSNQDFADYVSEHILSPLSMSQTAVRPQWDDRTSLLDTKAIGYSCSGLDGVFRIENWMRFRMYPAGSVNGTPSDLLKYANELAKGEGKPSLLFQTQEGKSTMFAETHRSFGSNTGLSHGFWQYPNAPGIVGHEGGTYGFKTQFWVEPKTERAIVIMTNVMETDFCAEIMHALVEQPAMEPETSIHSMAELRRLEGDYLPARTSWGNIAEIQGRIQAIQITDIGDGRLQLSMPFGSKEQIYRQTGRYQFYCEKAAPEEQIIAFSVEDGKTMSMSFRLAHDYVPVKGTQGVDGTILIIALYALCLLSWLVMLLLLLGTLVCKKRRAPLWKWGPALCGLLLGGSGILGLLHWFPAYTVNSSQLNFIVGCNWIFGIAAVCGCAYSMAKKRLRHAGITLGVLALQLFSVYQMGFLTFL